MEESFNDIYRAWRFDCEKRALATEAAHFNDEKKNINFFYLKKGDINSTATKKNHAGVNVRGHSSCGRVAKNSMCYFVYALIDIY